LIEAAAPDLTRRISFNISSKNHQRKPEFALIFPFKGYPLPRFAHRNISREIATGLSL